MDALVGAPVALGATTPMRAGRLRSGIRVRAQVRIVRIPVPECTETGSTPLIARRKALVVRRTAMAVIDNAAGKALTGAAIAARVFPAVAAQADRARWHVSVAIVIARGVSIPAAGVYHGVLQSLPEQPSRSFLVPAS
jgi:hypothetical protein